MGGGYHKRGYLGISAILGAVRGPLMLEEPGHNEQDCFCVVEVD